MSHSRRTALASVVAAVAAFPFAAALAGAQPVPTPRIPEIAVAATGEVKAAPDRATILFSVETRAATAAEASAENAERTQAVVAALRAAGLAADQVETVSYSIDPEMRYDEPSRASRVVGYVARNTVQAEIREIARLGRVIDAAVRAGSNGVSSLSFASSNAEALRLEALQRAMQRACREASALATAAGGTLGPLQQATSGVQPSYPQPVPMARMEMAASAADTPISPGDVAVMVLVESRWRFVPAGEAAPPGSPTCR